MSDPRDLGWNVSPVLGDRASPATVDPEELRRAFDVVFRATDEIDRHEAEATRSMKQTVTALEGQVSRAGLRLQRSRSCDPATANSGRSRPCLA